jgi:Zn-dependent metalloprotease
MSMSRFLGFAVLFVSLSAQAGDIIIYEAGFNPLTGLGNNKGALVLVNGQKAGSLLKRVFLSEDAVEANKNITIVRNFYRDNFGLNSFDGKDSNIEATVRVGRGLIDLFGLGQNAAWDGSKFLFGTGKDKGLNGFTKAIDIIGHEYTHAVVQYSSRLSTDGQSGALNEHLADVFGQMIQVASGQGADDFLIGETAISPEFREAARKKYGFELKGLRDMLHPEHSLPPQPTQMSEIPKEYGHGCKANATNDRCGVHLLAGIPNRAVALAVKELGWRKLARVFYVVMTERLKKDSQFAEYARETIGECQHQLSSSDCVALSNAFRTVGL